MSEQSPASAREALIAEALGEFAALLDRVDGVVRALEVATAAASDAGARIEARASAFEERAVALVEAAKQHLVRHVAAKTEELARTAGEAQVRAMTSAVQEMIRNELFAMRRLADGGDRGRARQRIQTPWWGYAATAIFASAITSVAMTYLLPT